MGEDNGTTPRTVMLIRHGEKPGDPTTDDDLVSALGDRSGKAGSKYLSPRGSARAVALPTLFLPETDPLACAVTSSSEDEPGFLGTYAPYDGQGPAPRFPRPHFVFATANSKHSHRPKQTARPTASALGLKLDDDYDNSEAGVDALAALMWTAPYAGKTVLICWHHGTMRSLAGQLGVKNAPAWDGSVFDQLWSVAYADDGTATLTVHGQKLLHGD